MKLFLFGLILCFLSCNFEKNSRNLNIIRFGNYKNRPVGLQSVNIPGGQSAVYMENSKKYSGKIMNILVYIGKKGSPKTKFIVRLYKKAPEKLAPGEKLLKDSLVFSSSVVQGWIEVNLKHFNLSLPQDGFFAGIEWLPQGKTLWELSPNNALNIAYNKQENTNNTWYKGNKFNWFQMDDSKYNAMIASDCLITNY